MTLPSWIEPKISLGNILTILAMIGAMMGFAQAYGGMLQKVDQHEVDIVSIRQDSLIIKSEASALKEQVQEDRLYARETLAEMKTDIGYIRRYVEEERRTAKQ